MVQALRRLGALHVCYKMRSFTGYEILLFDKKKPRLLILFHVIEFFLIQKLPMLVITDQTGRKLTFASCISTPHHPPPHGEACPSLACILLRLF